MNLMDKEASNHQQRIFPVKILMKASAGIIGVV